MRVLDGTSAANLLAIAGEGLSAAAQGGEDYAPVDALLARIPTARRIDPPSGSGGLGPVKESLALLAKVFQREGCSIPTEGDIQTYKMLRHSIRTLPEDPQLPPLSESHKAFVSRAWDWLKELEATISSSGRITAFPGLSPLFTGLLAFHVRHGVGDTCDFLPMAQWLQRALNTDLSEPFRKTEQEWAAHTAERLVKNEHTEAPLHEAQEFWRSRQYTSALDAISRYTRNVYTTTASFLGVERPPELRFDAADPYKYGYLTGLIPEERWSALTVSREGHLTIQRFDPESLRIGALAASRTFLEYATIQCLVPESERRIHTHSAMVDTWGYGKEALDKRAEEFKEDYWRIAAPLLAARTFRVNPCEPIALPTNPAEHMWAAAVTRPYLQGIEYLANFVRDVKAHMAAASERTGH